MIPATKRFSGKIYKKNSVHTSKSKARKQVTLLQKHDYYARSIKIGSDYIVYSRPKTK